MPLTLAWHCSKLEKPQLSVPPRPEYSAHHAAVAGVCVSTAGIITSAATITLALKRIASLLMLMENNLISHTPSAVLAHGPTSPRSSTRLIIPGHQRRGGKSKSRKHPLLRGLLMGRSNEPEGNRCCFADCPRTGVRTRSKSESGESEQVCRRRSSQLGRVVELSRCWKGSIRSRRQRKGKSLYGERKENTRKGCTRLVDVPPRRPHRLREVTKFLAHVHRACDLP